RLHPGLRGPRRPGHRDQPAAALTDHGRRVGARHPRHGPRAGAGGTAHAAGHPARRRQPPAGPARGPVRVLEAQREVMLLMRELADEVCDGRWLALGGGGYAVIDVVPRSWAHLIAIVTGDPLEAAARLPEEFLAAAEAAR